MANDTQRRMLPAHASDARNALLRWFDEHRRAMPWRDHPDPYAIWISEVMLQQTRVDTVRDYFDRWMRAFPTVDDLARASLDDVLHVWQGLGYYSRAKNLHRAAQLVAAAGAFPSTAETLRALPGVGPYTAGAIASIAFGEAAPLVDGNVMRVFTRWFGLDDDIASTTTQRRLWALAEAWVQGPRPGDFNQALMEWGSLVCTPRAPRCADCPVAATCTSRLQGAIARRPVKTKKSAARPEHRYAYLVTRADGALLVGQRPPTGLLAGLWEPPLSSVWAADDWQGAWRDSGMGPTSEPVMALSSVRHVFSHIRLDVTPLLLTEPDGFAPHRSALPYVAWDWVSSEGWEQRATSTLANKLRDAQSGAQLALLTSR